MTALGKLITGRFAQAPRAARWRALAVVVVTLALAQAALMGSLLTGTRIMLPLDALKTQNPAILCPPPPGSQEAQPPSSNTGLDLVLQFEPFRKFVVSQLRAGRFPLWNRYSYCGSPFMANAQSGVMSPYRAVDVAINSPVSTAWVQLVKSLVAGVGMYLFLRIALRARFLPSLAGAHLFAMCGFMLYFCGHPHTQAASWLPWIVLACDRLARRPGPGWLALASTTAALCFYCGHPQTTAHVYLCAALWTLGMLAHTARGKPLASACSGAAWIAAAAIITGLLAGPQLLATLDYLPWSLRLENRAVGKNADLVSGASGLMDLLMPYFQGSSLNKTLFFGLVNHAESMASGSVGLVWALFFAPLGILGRWKDPRVWIAAFLLVFGLGYAAGIPLVSALYDHGPLAMLSPNRLVLLSAFAVIALGAIGMDRLTRGHTPPRAALAACAALLALVLAVLIYSINSANQKSIDPSTPQALAATAGWFTQAYALAAAAVLALLAALWIILRTPRRARAIAVLIAAASVAEAFALAWGMYPSSPRADYYPPIPALEWVAQHTDLNYRACGYQCFPANLNLMYGIPDPRGYDALDPIPIVRLMDTFRARNVPDLDPDYATVSLWTPSRSPLLNMLAVKYLIFRGPVPPGFKPAFAADDYWVMQVPGALPRVYVPSEALALPTPQARMAALTDPAFSPGKTVILEAPVAIAPANGPISGQAAIRSDTGGEIAIKADMQTPGVMVLADLWYPGWHATVDGAPTPILRVNTTLKGLALTPGQHDITLVFWPASASRALWMFAAGVLALLAAPAIAMAIRRRKSA